MGFVEYRCGSQKPKLRELLKRRLFFRDRIRYHQKKSEYHLAQKADIEKVQLKEVEKQIDNLLKRER